MYIGIFCHIRNILPTETAIQIYYSVINSWLPHEIEVYGTECTSFLNLPKILQNSFDQTTQ